MHVVVLPDQPPMVLAGALPKPTFGQLSPTMPPTQGTWMMSAAIGQSQALTRFQSILAIMGRLASLRYTMMPTIPDPPKWGEPPTSGPVPPKMSKEQMQRPEGGES